MSTVTVTGADREFEVPARFRGPKSPQRLTAWELAHLDAETTPAGVLAWADQVVESVLTAAAAPAAAALDCPTCDDTGFYGWADLTDPEILRDLYRRNGDQLEVLQADGRWMPDTPDEALELLPLDVAQDLASAVLAGAGGLIRRYITPVAFLPPGGFHTPDPYPAALLAAPVAPAGPPGAPTPDAPEQAPTDDGNKWFNYAIVDPLDPGAVLNVVRLRPGPVMERYDKGGAWVPDPPVLASLTGIEPPPLVELDDSLLADVLKQVDSAGAAPAATAASGLDAKSRQQAADKGTALDDGSYPIRNRDELGKAISSLGRAKDKDRTKRHIIKRARALDAVGALPDDWGITADATTHHSGNPNAAKLRQYWTHGKGALKIRWGTPGDFGRCYTHTKKFMGERAKGYCAQLHKDATGSWPGSKKNLHGSAGSNLAASMGMVSTEESLIASVRAGAWAGTGTAMTTTTEYADGIYEDISAVPSVVFRSLVAGAFPVTPPHEWFQNPQLTEVTPTVVEDSGRVYGHMADWQRAHIGLPGRVPPPRSASGYRYFATGLLNTLKADGSRSAVPVGQLTLVGGHASMKADAGQAVKHYDDTQSGVADVRVGEDRHGIWFAGALRPGVTPEQVRVLMASSLSGDWRPINGHLELVACCSVNVPGFPIARACVAGGAVMALTAAGAMGVAVKRAAAAAEDTVAARLAYLEAMVAALLDGNTDGVVVGEDIPAVGDDDAEFVESPTEPDPNVLTVDVDEPVAEVPTAVARARQHTMERRARQRAAVHRTTFEDELAKLVASAATPVVAAFKLEDWMAPTGSDGQVIKTGATVAVSSKNDESVAVGRVKDVTKRGIVVQWKSGRTGTSTIAAADVSALVRVTAAQTADTGEGGGADPKVLDPTTVASGVTAAFSEAGHPRDHNGRFISIGDKVNVKGDDGKDRRGEVTQLTKMGPQVKYDDGGDPPMEIIPSGDSDRITVAPKATAALPGVKPDGPAARPAEPKSQAEYDAALADAQTRLKSKDPKVSYAAEREISRLDNAAERRGFVIDMGSPEQNKVWNTGNGSQKGDTFVDPRGVGKAEDPAVIQTQITDGDADPGTPVQVKGVPNMSYTITSYNAKTGDYTVKTSGGTAQVFHKSKLVPGGTATTGPSKFGRR